ncbi:MAG: aminotransferase class I/II-fold pyridoxal phosphate-dependent enzyme [Porphyromonas sp.]|nr:aminotransferase class I/II-fold pyridoxal phosphate-dependent enzyme [Porphyromonas sp.]
MQKRKKQTAIKKESAVLDYSKTQWLGADLRNLKAHLIEHIDLISQYPEREAETIIRLLSRRLEVSEKSLIVTDGSTGAFHLIASGEPAAKSLLLTPTNSEFAHALRRAGHEVVEQSGVTDLSKLELEGISYLWISNPNAPDGRFYSRRSMLKLLRENPDVTVIVDLSIAGFVIEENLKASDVQKYKNLIVVSSFSNVYNVPGIRVGYVVASPSRIEAFHKIYTPLCIGTLALEATRFILLHPAQLTIPIRKWLRAANELSSKLASMERVNVLPSHTPFFILELEGIKGQDLAEYLMNEHRVKVGTQDDDIQLADNQVTITALPQSEANERLLQGISSFISSLGTSEE